MRKPELKSLPRRWGFIHQVVEVLAQGNLRPETGVANDRSQLHDWVREMVASVAKSKVEAEAERDEARAELEAFKVNLAAAKEEAENAHQDELAPELAAVHQRLAGQETTGLAGGILSRRAGIDQTKIDTILKKLVSCIDSENLKTLLSQEEYEIATLARTASAPASPARSPRGGSGSGSDERGWYPK